LQVPLSYYDTSLSEVTSYSNPIPTKTYLRNYEYDPLGLSNSIGCGSDTVWGANIFRAGASAPRIAAVSTYALTDNTAYVLDIYKNVSADQPMSGKRIARKTGTLRRAGYHTIALKTQVTVAAGRRFSVVMKLTTPGYPYPLPVEGRYAGYSSAANSNPGQSFGSCDGTVWDDLYGIFSGEYMNASIKAFGIAPVE
jgi:hypothetical protein